ncbi:hypothetical protein [Lysinibacillus fusiformis]|uniref:hypothetical protein n=1 Tax=Lysinibacillus fusiformis TaxID=28031 RepID=UPI003D03F38B
MVKELSDTPKSIHLSHNTSSSHQNFSGLATLNDATSPQFLQNDKISGEPEAIKEPIGLTLLSVDNFP